MSSPFFSIVVPVYNSHQYLRECLESVLNQTFRDFELIIVDDGSTDCSFDICTGYANSDDRIRLLRHEHNRGASAARNTGLLAATGEYLLFLDNDDYWVTNLALEKLKSVISSYTAPDFICFPMGEMRSGMDAPSVPHDSLDCLCNSVTSYKELLHLLIGTGRYYSSASGKVVRVDLIRRYDLQFDLKLKYNEDTEWSRNLLLHSSSAGWMGEAFYIYRRNSTISQSAVSVPVNVMNCLAEIVERHCVAVADKTCSSDALELCSDFISYIYVLLLSYVGMCSGKYDRAFCERVKSQAWLLSCGRSTRVRVTRWFYKLFGFGITSRLLAFVMKSARRCIQG